MSRAATSSKVVVPIEWADTVIQESEARHRAERAKQLLFDVVAHGVVFLACLAFGTHPLLQTGTFILWCRAGLHLYQERARAPE